MKFKTLLFMTALATVGCTGKPVSDTEGETDGKKDINIQLYSVRDKILPDYSNLDSLLFELGKMGYTGVEAANYNEGKFYGRTPQEFREAVEKAGMVVLSSHTGRGLTAEELDKGDLQEALKWWDRCIADHKAAGMSYIVTPWMDVPASLKDLQTYCRYYDEIGKRCRETESCTVTTIMRTSSRRWRGRPCMITCSAILTLKMSFSRWMCTGWYGDRTARWIISTSIRGVSRCCISRTTGKSDRAAWSALMPSSEMPRWPV